MGAQSLQLPPGAHGTPLTANNAVAAASATVAAAAAAAAASAAAAVAEQEANGGGAPQLLPRQPSVSPTMQPAPLLPHPSGLKAITIKQPFIAGILAGKKLLENRSWGAEGNRPLRFPPDGKGLWFAAHASSQPAQRTHALVQRLMQAWPEMPPLESLACSAILGFFRVKDVVPVSECADDPQAVGPWCWRIDKVAATARPGCSTSLPARASRRKPSHAFLLPRR